MNVISSYGRPCFGFDFREEIVETPEHLVTNGDELVGKDSAA